MKRKRKQAALVPRLGPAQNLRPAGAHEQKTAYNRKKQKAALRRYAEDGFFDRCISSMVPFIRCTLVRTSPSLPNACSRKPACSNRTTGARHRSQSSRRCGFMLGLVHAKAPAHVAARAQ